MKKWIQILSGIKTNLYPIMKGVEITAAIFALILCVLLIVNYFQTKAIDPINSPALQTLMQKLEETPGEKMLQDQIRALDLLARKAYFASQWQIRTGGFILLGTIGILVITIKSMSNLRKKLPHPEGCPDEDTSWLTATNARKWIAFGGTFLLCTSLLAAVLSHNDIANLHFNNGPVAAPTNEDFLKNWTNFRGPGGNGIAPMDKAPVNWNGETGKDIKWKTKIPLAGFSSPVVWKDRVWVTGADEKIREVYCLDAETGNIIWTQQVKDIPGSPDKAPNVHGDTGFAASTAATNGRQVFAIFANGDLVCLDMDGNHIWGQNLGLPDNHYGYASSLMTYENLLIVQWDQNSQSRLLALDALSGNTVWRVNRTVISWSSPIIVNTGNRTELILTNSTSIDSYDPKTGIKLWGEDCLGGEMGPSAAYADGWVYGANDYAVVAGLKITDSGAELVWEYDENMPDTASPLTTDKYLFIACSYGYIICLNAKTGEFIWEQEFDDGFYSSPILVGNLVYAMDMQGVMHIFEAADTYKSVGDPILGEPSSCTPAFVENKVFIRGDNHLYCIEENE